MRPKGWRTDCHASERADGERAEASRDRRVARDDHIELEEIAPRVLAYVSGSRNGNRFRQPISDNAGKQRNQPPWATLVFACADGVLLARRLMKKESRLHHAEEALREREITFAALAKVAPVGLCASMSAAYAIT